MEHRKTLGKKLRFEVFKRDRFTCQYCGATAPDAALHVDHITPVAGGGGNDILNLITSCAACNGGKGATLLSDDSELTKRRRQLEELEDRRETLAMMLEWHRELGATERDELTQIADHWNERTSPYELSDAGQEELSKLLRRFGVEEVLEAMKVGRDKLRVDESGNVTLESFQEAWSLTKAVCHARRAQKEKPYLRELYRIRARVRARFTYFDNRLALRMLESAHVAGATIQLLDEIADFARNWTEWRNALLECIEAQSAAGNGFEALASTAV